MLINLPPAGGDRGGPAAVRATGGGAAAGAGVPPGAGQQTELAEPPAPSPRPAGQQVGGAI